MLRAWLGNSLNIIILSVGVHKPHVVPAFFALSHVDMCIIV